MPVVASGADRSALEAVVVAQAGNAQVSDVVPWLDSAVTHIKLSADNVVFDACADLLLPTKHNHGQEPVSPSFLDAVSRACGGNSGLAHCWNKRTGSVIQPVLIPDNMCIA